MRHPEDLPDAIGWFVALLAASLAWGVCLLLLAAPWSHILGIGVGGTIIVYVMRWWKEANKPNS